MGSVNLGFCHVAFSTEQRRIIVKRWQIVSLECGGTEVVQITAEFLLQYLDRSFREQVPDCATVLIEDQPPTKNTKTYALSYATYAFMRLRAPAEVRFIDSKKKGILCDLLKVNAPLGASDRRANKLRAIVAVETILTALDEKALLSWFMRQRKQDDLADSFLQALATFCEATNNENFIVEKVLTSHCPVIGISETPAKGRKRNKKKKKIKTGLLVPGT